MDGTVSTCWSCMSRGVPHQRCSARQVIHELDAHQMRQTQYIYVSWYYVHRGITSHFVQQIHRCCHFLSLFDPYVHSIIEQQNVQFDGQHCTRNNATPTQ